MIWPHLDHVELGNAVLLHTHGHGDAVLFDEHCEERGSSGSGRRRIRGTGTGRKGKGDRNGEAPIGDLSNGWLKPTLMVPVGRTKQKHKKDEPPRTCIIFTFKTQPP